MEQQPQPQASDFAQVLLDKGKEEARTPVGQPTGGCDVTRLSPIQVKCSPRDQSQIRV